MIEDEATIAPVRKDVVVQCSPARAFWIFTRDIDAWWPTKGHSVGEDRSESVRLEPRLGGRVIETHSGGEEVIWGTILAWQPPHRLVLTWHPGRSARDATEVEVVFAAHGEDTRVTLEHRGWERRRDGRAAQREYDQGWIGVLESFRLAGGRPPQYQVLVHRPGITWRSGVPFREQPGIDRHQGFMSQLESDGVLVIGGPFLDEESGGMAVLRAGSVAEATRLAHTDPSIETGLLAVTVRPWLAPMRNPD